MNSLLKNKSFITYSLIFLLVVPIFGFNFLISFIGNILLLIFLIPILILIVTLIGFNSFKSNVKNCNECGTISIGLSNTCTNCGADLNNINKDNFQEIKDPSERIIEVKAEEINN